MIKGREEMTELEMPSCSKNKEMSKVNGGGQTQMNASAESWYNQVKNAIASPSKLGQPSMWKQSKKVCIYRVPKYIMISKEEAYAPSVVSFGPYKHKMDPTLSPMDQHKVEAVNRMLQRLDKDGQDVSILTEEIQILDNQIRECYDEAIEWDKNTLSLMLVMDACFILEFLRPYIVRKGCCRCNIYENSNYENTMHSFHMVILNDIMKLENQIPWFIPKALLKLEFEGDDEVASHLKGLLPFVMSPFSYPSSSDGQSIAEGKLIQCIKKDPFHLLDLKRMVITDLLTDIRKERATGADSIKCLRRCNEWFINVAVPGSVQRLSSTPCAELLHKVGIKFQPGKIGFGNCKLSLPQILVQHNTETELMNLMAYEDCRRPAFPEQTVISHFVCFLNDLIESEKDVSILKEDRIIQSYLGSDKEVADIFNHLGKGIYISKDYGFKFESVVQQAIKHYYSPWKKPVRRVKEAYCSKPFYWVSILAGTAILVMTAVQMAYAIKNG